MSRHEGVSCDSCLKGNFRGRRYKCLICYDYDLCSTCYDSGASTSRHSRDHPMQCILTRVDFDLFYGGEAITSDTPQSFTCPYCGRMGFTEQTLLEHVTSEHSDQSLEVICPICASLPVGEPNLVTDDFAGHLTLEHRNPARDLISFLEEPSRHNVRRIPPVSARGMPGSRARRNNVHFSSTGTLASISPSSRESVDPIAELLSQLSGVRRNQASSSQLQHLQMQLQLERQQVRVRHQLDRLPRRPHGPLSTASTGTTTLSNTAVRSLDFSNCSQDTNSSHQMVARFLEHGASESELGAADEERADISLFVCELLLGSLLASNQDLHRDNLISGILSNPVPAPPSRLAGRLGPVPRSYSAITNFRARLSLNSQENSSDNLTRGNLPSVPHIETDLLVDDSRIPSSIAPQDLNSLASEGTGNNSQLTAEYSFPIPNMRLFNSNPGYRHHDSGDHTSHEAIGGNNLVFGLLDLREEFSHLPESGDNVREARSINSVENSLFPGLGAHPSNRINSEEPGEFVMRDLFSDTISVSSRNLSNSNMSNSRECHSSNQNDAEGNNSSPAFRTNETGNKLAEKEFRKDKPDDDPSCSQ